MTRPAGGKPHYRMQCYPVTYPPGVLCHGSVRIDCYRVAREDIHSDWSVRRTWGPWSTSSAEAIRRAPR